MCGIFGFAGKEPNPALLREVAEQAARRGPHSTGVARLTTSGVEVKKSPGTKDLAKLVGGIQANALVGNCRLSTSGTHRDEKNNQPIVARGIAVSHNGNIREHKKIAADLGAILTTQCDSEIICHLVAQFGVPEAISRLADYTPLALLILQRGKLTAFRVGQPLYSISDDSGRYFCSRPFAAAMLIPENEIVEVSV